MPTNTVQPGICRFDVDENNTHGFMVRIMRRGIAHQEFFSDAQYGNKTRAKKAAIARREELIRELPAPITPYNRRTVRNSSGKVGVHLARDTDARTAGHETYHYVASWRADDGRRVNLKFSWRKHGQRLAWQLAVVARENKVRDRERIVKLHEKRSGRFPSMPKHPEIEDDVRRAGRTAGSKPKVAAKKKAVKKTRTTKSKASGKQKTRAAAPKKKSAVKKTAVKKKSSRPTKKQSAKKKAATKRTASARPAKSVKKKAGKKKATAKKTAVKKTAVKKTAVKKTAVKKTAVKKTAVKKTAVKKKGAKLAARKKAATSKKASKGRTRRKK